MKNLNSFREILDLISPDSDVLFIVPAYNEKNKTADYLYLLHKDMILGKEKPEVKGIKDWEHYQYVWSSYKKRPSALHCNWVELRDYRSIIRYTYLWVCLILYKKSGGKIIWTIHNKIDHYDSLKWLNKKIRTWLVTRADILRVHCRTAATEIAELYDVDKSRFVVVPHPRFPAYLLPRSAAIEALNHRFGFSLESRNKIYLMFGNIGPNKQILETIDIFKSLSGNKKLMIVGPVKQGHMSYYRNVQKSIKKYRGDIHLLPKIIQSDIVPEFFNAADICLFNYSEILTSGGVELARSYQKAIIAPAKGCIQEMKDNPNVSLFHTEDQFKKLLTDS